MAIIFNTVNKTFDIDLDVKYSATHRKISLTEGDTGVVFHIVLTDEGTPVDLSGTRVLAVFANSQGTGAQDSESAVGGVTIGGESNNEITILLKPARFAAGYNECEIQVYSGDLMETLITTARFNFTAVPSVLNPESIRDDDRYPILLDLIRQVKDIQASTGDMTRAAYDPDEDGSVLLADHAEHAEDAFSAQHLNGRSETYFATASDLDTEEAAREALAVTVSGITRQSLGAAAMSTKSEATLLAASWAENVYTLSVAGATATNAIELCIPEAITAEQLEALQGANIVGVSQTAGSITLKAFGDVPEIDLPITVIVRGDL